MSNDSSSTSDDSNYPLNERIPLVIYYITCTFLTLSLNSLALYTIVKKVQLSGRGGRGRERSRERGNGGRVTN